MSHEWHHVPQKPTVSVGQRIAAFLGIEKPPVITYQPVPRTDELAYNFPESYRLISSADTPALWVRYSDRRKISEEIESVIQAEHPDMMSPAIRAAELFRGIGVVKSIVITSDTIIVDGGNPEDHQKALNGVAHEHSIFFGRAKIIPAEIQ